MFDLTGRKALVTGATGGLGGAIARTLHAQGASVALSGTRAEALEALAVELGERITVVATVRSTLGPSVRLVKRAAAEAGKTVTVQELLVDGALDVLVKQGDRDLHYKMVLDAIAAAEKTSDVIVSAQGSVAILEPQLTKLAKPILTSPQSGVADQSPARKLSTVLPQSVTLSMFSAFVPVLDSRDF